MARLDDVGEQLAKVDLFAGLNPKVLAKVREQGEVSSFPAGTVITAEGTAVHRLGNALPDRNLFFHLILTGGTEVRRGDAVLTTLGPGQYFGELSLIDGGPRTADVIAGPDGATTFALPDGAFQRLLAEHPEIAVPMLRVLAARIRNG